MPELPEVETIKRGLLERVKGKKVKKVSIKNPKCISFPSPGEFKERIEGRVFREINRKGKYLIIELDSGENLVFHLKLTGRILYSPEEGKEFEYVRVIFAFEEGDELSFTDIRGFGSIWLIPDKEFDKIPGLESLGPEPLEEDFTLESFQKMLKSKRGKIKVLLMDQTFLAGVGNIYAQEALFLAGIHPERPSSSLTSKEVKKLYDSLRFVLTEAIQYRGSSVDAYVDVEGRKGNYEEKLRVYGKEGGLCPSCSTPIRKITISGRGTYFCPRCQK